MAHEIETYGDQAAAIFAREDAWHRLGTTMPAEFTAEQAMEIAHLGNWKVRKEPLTTTVLMDDGVHSLQVPGQFASVRTSPFTGNPEVLGVVGSNYVPIQNEEHAEFLNNLVDQSGAHFDTAGSLRAGREVFITMRMPEEVLIGGVDRCELNLIALNSHDGRSAFRVLTDVTRVVCANTQRAALRNTDNIFRVRHTRSASSVVAQARDALGVTFAYVDEFQAEAEAMIQATLTSGQFMDIMRAEFGAPADAAKAHQTKAQQILDDLDELYFAETNAAIVGTTWGGFQAVAEYVDHFAAVQAKGLDAGDVRAERAILGGAWPQVKEKAFATFRTLAGV